MDGRHGADGLKAYPAPTGDLDPAAGMMKRMRRTPSSAHESITGKRKEGDLLAGAVLVKTERKHGSASKPARAGLPSSVDKTNKDGPGGAIATHAV